MNNADGYVVIGTKLDNSGIEKDLQVLENQANGSGNKIGNIFTKATQKASKLGKGIITGIGSAVKGFAGILATVVAGLIKGLAKIAIISAGLSLSLGAIGVIAVILKKAFEKVVEENQQFATDVKYIGFAFSTALQPAVEAVANILQKIIAFLLKMIQYTAYIIQAWTGKNIFKNAGTEEFAKNMAKANKDSKKTAQNAKEIKKQLAGFDEMNILSDNTGTSSDTGTSAGGGGIGTPSFDLSKIQGTIPEWIKWIGENGELILAIIGGITAALISLKLLGLDPIVSLGIGIAVAGLILLIQDIIKFIQDPSWDGFAKILADLAILLTGVAIAMIAVNASNPVGWILLAISFLATLIATVIKYRDEIKEAVKKVVDWVVEKFVIVKTFLITFKNNIITGIKNIITNIKNFFGQIPSFINGVISKIVTAFKNLGKKAGEVIGNAFKTVINGILKTIEDVLNAPIKAINKLLDKINDIPGINLNKLSTLKLPRLARGGIINMPGRGIPVGSAIAGERSREAVLPLTDSQQMQLLGEAIGRYININATIPIQIGNRQVAREVRRINAEDDFAFNR